LNKIVGAKVNIPSILSGFDKSNNVKEFVLEMDNYYDVQRPKRDKKVSKALYFLYNMCLSDGLAKVHNSLRWWQT
jgi:hypothetical protein